MKPTWKTKWLEALRSGEYKRTEGKLCQRPEGRGKVSRYCCLGVLCDIVQPKGWKDNAGFYSDETHFQYGKEWSDGNGMPPSNILNKVGLDLSDAEILADMNDTGEPFSKIANYIEKNL